MNISTSPSKSEMMRVKDLTIYSVYMENNFFFLFKTNVFAMVYNKTSKSHDYARADIWRGLITTSLGK